jgi:hypothetical protein
MAMRAVENLDDDLDMDVPTLEHRKVRQTASKDVLDRAGFIKRKKPADKRTTNLQMNVIAKMSKEELYEHANRMFKEIQSKRK